MTEQFEIALKIFTDIYGFPKWEKEAKEGQNYQEIVKLWENELKDYTVEQVKVACYRVIKYRKSMTFPTISHLLAELCDEEKIKDTKSESERVLWDLINHQPELSELTIQRTMWRMYGIKYNNYKPEEDKGFK